MNYYWLFHHKLSHVIYLKLFLVIISYFTLGYSKLFHQLHIFSYCILSSFIIILNYSIIGYFKIFLVIFIWLCQGYFQLFLIILPYVISTIIL
jgi:hypothetical protein